MKKKDIQELKNKSVSELQKMFQDERGRLKSVVSDFYAKKLKNVKKVKEIKKDIARILTFIRKNDI